MIKWFKNLFKKQDINYDNKYNKCNTKMFEYLPPNLCITCKNNFRSCTISVVRHSLKCYKCGRIWSNCYSCGTPKKKNMDKVGILDSNKFICWDCYIV